VKPVEFAIARTWEGMWALNGAVVPEVGNCIDVDFGFTPATNLIQLRRLALEVGKAADAPAAWFDVSERTLVFLPQRYERRSESTYWYESPNAGYEALLEAAPNGFVRRYPGLWEMEP